MEHGRGRQAACRCFACAATICSPKSASICKRAPTFYPIYKLHLLPCRQSERHLPSESIPSTSYRLPGPLMAPVGWTSTPNQRGTFDIIWICAETIFLCAWTSVCVNVPAPGRSPWRLLREKAHFVLLAFLGPELVFLLSYVQLQSAKASVEEFRAAGFTDWTLVHAFYADMGGITVCSPSWPPFPVTTRQLFYLVRHGYMDYPKIPLEDIAARGQADGLSRWANPVSTRACADSNRLITICQVVYFAVTSIARVAQGLAFTTLELTVLGFILCTLATSICWWHEPNNVEVGHKFVLKKSIEDIVREAGQAANGSYRETPLDFVTPERWSGNVLWPYYTNILRKSGCSETGIGHVLPDGFRPSLSSSHRPVDPST